MFNCLLGSSLLTSGTKMFSQALESGALVLDLHEGVVRLNQLYGAKVHNTPDLWGIDRLRPYLEQLRSIALNHSKILDNPSALLLLNPHTHWGEDHVVRIEYQPNYHRLDIGPIDIHYEAFYWPVSFVITDNQAVPYEWMVEDHIPNFSLYKAAIEYIKDVCCISDTTKTGFGIGYHYRNFLTSSKSIVGTIEVSDVEYVAHSSIYARDDYEVEFRKDSLKSLEYVAWPFLIKINSYGLTSEEAALVEEIWTLLDTAETKQDRQAMWSDVQYFFNTLHK